MRLRFVEQGSPREWDETVRSLGGSIFHSVGWADYVLAGQPHAVPLFFSLVSDDGEEIGAAVGFHERSRRRLLASLTGRLRMDALPVVKDGDARTFGEFLRLLEDYAVGARDSELLLGSFASPDGADSLRRAGYSVTERLEFQIALGPSEEELWENLDYKRRKNLKKAARLGVIVEDLPVDEGVAALRRLQGASAERIVQRGGPDITRRGGEGQDPVGKLAASGLGRLVGARVGGEIVSASLFTCFNGLVYHTLSGHGPEALKTQAPTLLLWETVKRYRREGAARFNLGGCSVEALREDSPEHGVYAYKKAFGGACLRCASGEKILRSAAHGIVRIARALIRR